MGRFKVIHTGVYGIPEAIYGMRNPMDSHSLSDSTSGDDYTIFNPCCKLDIKQLLLKDYIEKPEGNIYSNKVEFKLGDNDYKLAKSLIMAGKDHRKFLRQIHVNMQIKASMGWWAEMDTYKVGTTRNSSSTMHRLGKRLLTNDDFIWYSDFNGIYFDDSDTDMANLNIIARINDLIDSHASIPDIKEVLPQSFAYTCMWSGNYEVLRNIYHNRRNHRMPEWKLFCRHIDEYMPESWMITYSSTHK